MDVEFLGLVGEFQVSDARLLSFSAPASTTDDVAVLPYESRRRSPLLKFSLSVQDLVTSRQQVAEPVPMSQNFHNRTPTAHV